MQLEQQRETTSDVEMGNSSAPSRDMQVSFPSLHFLTEFQSFTHEFDSTTAYEIPAAITSIEWLNRSSDHPAMTFLVANDKKIRLFKLKPDFFEDLANEDENMQDSDGHEDRETSFVDRFL